ncbi:uncharacterized protein LOC106471234 isoform X2 [Limulus polyphemus]|uniref:Uncharacterized protein LOC106471234 isoform X2 n=1 Tax=Limulus polyphemus TaxID=6850 RepID=A0ABM1TKP7_LIMPO|nr:uncharacterized protein LOC106471234 isoform X2 [Limulus polyphemus]
MSFKKYRNHNESPEKSDDACCEMYVGNYPSTFGEKDLFRIFQGYDIVKVRKLFKKDHKVFAFVQFKSKESVKKAVEELSDYDIQGRKLKLHAMKGKKENNKRNFRNNTYNKPLTKGSYESLSLDRDEPPPLGHDEPPPLGQDETPPLEHDGPPPLEHDGPPPLEHDGPPPLEHDGPPPLEYDGPPPLEYDKPPPLEHDGPPPLEYVGPLPLERVSQRKLVFHQPMNYRTRNSRPSPSESHYTPYYPQRLWHDYVFPTVVDPCLAYRRKPLSNTLSSVSSNDGYLAKDHFEERTLVSIMNFPHGTTRQDILQLFDLFEPLDVEMINNAPILKRPLCRSFLLMLCCLGHMHGFASDLCVCDPHLLQNVTLCLPYLEHNLLQIFSSTQALVLLPTLEMAEAAVMELDNTWFKKCCIMVSIVEKDKYESWGLLEEYKYSKGRMAKSFNDKFAEMSLHH